jgi:signal transduction histidine kinase
MVPALPGLGRWRIEAGVFASFIVEALLWPSFGDVPVLELLPVFSVLVAGLLSTRRWALAATSTAVAIQLAQLTAWRMGFVAVDGGDTAVMVGQAVLLVVVGLGFAEIGAVLRDYQARVVEQTREELRLTELIDEKDHLIDSVAHELRTPLTAVLGLSSELAAGTAVDATETRMLAGIVADEARRLAGIVDNLVVAARSEIDRLGADCGPVAVAELASQVWVGTGGEPRDLSVAGDAVVFADRRRLAHLLANLFDNAVRHGRPPVQVSIAHTANGASVTVIDAGAGIHGSVAEAAFDRYRSGGDPNRPDNLGLGLAVARTLAEAMGGSLAIRDRWVELTIPEALSPA